VTRNWQRSQQLAAAGAGSCRRGCQLRRWLPVAVVVLVACSGGSDSSTPTTLRAATTVSTVATPSTSTTLPPTTTTTSSPRAANDPAALAQQLDDGERTIRDPAAPPDAVDAAGMLVQLAYRRLAAHPEWQAQVLGAIDPAYQSSAQHNLTARNELRAMHTTLSDTLPAWRIVDPLPDEQLLAYYQEGEATYGVPWSVLAAVNLIETGMGRIQGLSVAGAQGPMQFLPGTWERYGLGGDVEDPHDAILGAANYLAANGGADGTDEGLDNALFHYNNSNHYVTGVRELAAAMAEEPVTLRGYHAWEVVYASTVGDVLLASGYESAAPQPAADYVAAHPEALLG
jgi:membrane-bound lytic murein transglycosylase B